MNCPHCDKFYNVWHGSKPYCPSCDSETGQMHRRIAFLEVELRAASEVVLWAQAVLTALNVGNVASESPLHKKLREVMIQYRARGEGGT